MTTPTTDRKRAAPDKIVRTTASKTRTAASVAKASPAKLKPNSPVVAQPAEHAKVKHKLVRDSFTIPKSEYALLEALKARATDLRRPAKKGELLRAGIAALHGMPDNTFLSALARIPSLKTGRPKISDTVVQPARNTAQ